MELKEIVKQNKSGSRSGIYSVCSAHPLVIEAALQEGLASNSTVLIEATANQVNHLGGYTGMTPNDFIEFINKIATEVGFPTERIILGGDHLGPTCWTHLSSEEAMQQAKLMVESYAKAGFTKIHLDASMSCLDDIHPLSDEIIAQRATELCMIAEASAKETFGKSEIYYVIGTEVPPPGGASETISTIDPTQVANVKKTIELHHDKFIHAGLTDALERVIAVVVQPGVEFDNYAVAHYDADATRDLTKFIQSQSDLCFEAHSTDYQLDKAYSALVDNHFAILKVGPQLTFALREALFSLAQIEDILYANVKERSNLITQCKTVMNEHPEYWENFYSDVPIDELDLAKFYSYSDRIRYYWNMPELQKAVNILFDNLSSKDIPLPLISQYMPGTYDDILDGELKPIPKSMVIHHIMKVTKKYSNACSYQH